jgi:hypothetical protein
MPERQTASLYCVCSAGVHGRGEFDMSCCHSDKNPIFLKANAQGKREVTSKSKIINNIATR